MVSALAGRSGPATPGTRRSIGGSTAASRRSGAATTDQVARHPCGRRELGRRRRSQQARNGNAKIPHLRVVEPCQDRSDGLSQRAGGIQALTGGAALEMPYPNNRIASSNLARSASPPVAQSELAHPNMVGGTRHTEARTSADVPCEGAAFPENGVNRAGNAAPPAESHPRRAFGTTANVRSTAGELHYLSDGGCSVLADDPARWRSPAARALVAGTDPG